MTYRYSPTSLKRLETCDPRLKDLFMEVIKHLDVSILEGHRNAEDQNRAFKDGRSQVKWPDSNHNKVPSRAVDVAPYPIDWQDTEAFVYMAGFVKGIASQMGIPLRWGGDWNRNNRSSDESFRDLPHFELDG